MFRIPDAMRSGQGENAADQREQKGEHVRKFPDADAVPGEAAFLVMELESFGAGGRWLLECWNQLGAILDQGLAWDALEVFKAIRLLGMCPFDLNSVLGLTAVIQACRMLDPGSLALIDEVWNELIPADPSKFPGWRPPVAPPENAAAALQELLDIVKSRDREARGHQPNARGTRGARTTDGTGHPRIRPKPRRRADAAIRECVRQLHAPDSCGIRNAGERRAQSLRARV